MLLRVFFSFFLKLEIKRFERHKRFIKRVFSILVSCDCPNKRPE